jgi:DNA processing protein
MHTIYPTGNRLLAAEMLKNGGLLTEFRETEGPEAAHFPMRNRIIAGMSEATLVVESGIEGGSMITAKLAYGYNRAVLAIPGRLTDVKSNGCNALMAGDAAHCVTTAEDIARRLQWDIRPTPSVRTHTGSPVMDILGPGDPIHIDDLLARSGLPRNSLSTQLLILELEGTIESLPGNRYRLIF